MGRYVVDIAKPSDDEALRALAAGTPMDGPIEITVRREPSFFQATDVHGPTSKVIVMRDTQTGQIVGSAMRSSGQAYINGEETSLGYMGGLRIDPIARHGTLLARGYQAFRRLHEEGQADLCVTTIIEDNHDAQRLLTSRRAGLPGYIDWGRYVTATVPCVRRRKSRPTKITVERGTVADAGEIADCLGRNGRDKQFFPVRTADELVGDMAYLRGLAINDFFIARKAGQVVGVVAAWDQSDFKQTYVTGYHGLIGKVRPCYNVGARLFGLTRLPPAGTQLRHFYLSLIAIDDNDPRVFRDLLFAVHGHAVDYGYDYFLVGLHERDPLLNVAQEYRPILYRARLYVVDFSEDLSLVQKLDDRVPYLELATL